MRSSSLLSFALSSLVVVVPLLAFAGDEAKKTDATSAASTGGSASATTTTDSTTAASTTTTAPATSASTSTNGDKPASTSDPVEVEGQTYYFIGARYRHTFLPKWMLNLFVDGGPSVVSIPSFGVEGGFRKDGFDIIGAITYADYGMPTFPFKGKSEADTAYERVTSNLKLINLSVDFLWGTDFSPKFSFQYGATAGLAIVLGDLHRNQAKPPTGTSPSDPNGYVDCPPEERGKSAYCDDSNDHYGNYTDASWFNGGKKPNLYPIFGPMIAFRYKPVKQFVARLDGGFNLFSGFFFGLGLSYGI